MDELVKLVTEKAGISEDQANKAIEAVLGFVKEKLPAPLAGQIDGLVGGKSAGGLGSMLGGFLGKK